MFLPAKGNVRGDVDADPLIDPPSSPTSLLPITLVATMKTVYINNVHTFTVSHRLRELHQEPRKVFISSWTPGYLARYSLGLEGSSRYCAGAASEVPLTLCVGHQEHPAQTEFRIHFDQCGGKLFAEVEFTAMLNPFGGTLPRRRREPRPNYCHASGSAHEHINAWPNGSRSFFGGDKVVQLTATHWVATNSFCFDIRLGGAYASAHKPPSQDTSESQSSFQAVRALSLLLYFMGR